MASTNRIALVTGATGQLGRLVTATLAGDGHRLVLAGTDDARLRSAASDLGLDDERWTPVVADLADREATHAAIDGAVERFGGIDILIHLVGGWASGGPVTELDRDALRDQLDQHLWTTLNVVESVVPGMTSRGWGRVVAVATPFATEPRQGQAAYAISKVAQETLIRILARELGDTGVTANVVVVRKIDTDLERETAPSSKNAAWVTPAEIAATMRYLVSDEAAAVNGARIPLDGRG